MTTTLLKYILRGMLKGVEEYEAMLEKEHVDPKGKLAEILPFDPETILRPMSEGMSPMKPSDFAQKSVGEKIDLDALLKGQ